MRIGVQIQPQHADYAEIRRAVIAAEEMGVDIIYNWDHFYPLSGEPDGKHFEAWTTLASWAEITERVRARPAGDLQLVPQPPTSGRHGPHRRSHLRWPG